MEASKEDEILNSENLKSGCSKVNVNSRKSWKSEIVESIFCLGISLLVDSYENQQKLNESLRIWSEIPVGMLDSASLVPSDLVWDQHARWGSACLAERTGRRVWCHGQRSIPLWSPAGNDAQMAHPRVVEAWMSADPVVRRGGALRGAQLCGSRSSWNCRVRQPFECQINKQNYSLQ